LHQVFTNSEKQAQADLLEEQKLPDIVTEEDLIRQDGDYMRRQPRVDFAKTGNYNFEQFTRYTR
jgi:hypothetical protein